MKIQSRPMSDSCMGRITQFHSSAQIRSNHNINHTVNLDPTKTNFIWRHGGPKEERGLKKPHEKVRGKKLQSHIPLCQKKYLKETGTCGNTDILYFGMSHVVKQFQGEKYCPALNKKQQICVAMYLPINGDI